VKSGQVGRKSRLAVEAAESSWSEPWQKDCPAASGEGRLGHGVGDDLDLVLGADALQAVELAERG
jgi:hypothetical protein